MSPVWVWFFAVLSGIASVVGIIRFVLWLLDRSRKKAQKKPAEKKFTGKFYTKWGFWIAVVSVLATIFFGFWGIMVSCSSSKTEATKPKEPDSSFVNNKTESVPEKDTAPLIENEPTKPTANTQKDSTSKVPSPKPNDTTCAIIYLKGDLNAESDARITRDFLASKKPGNLKDYPLIDEDAKWFIKNKLFIEGGTDIQLYYNYEDSVHRDLAKRVYYRLSEGLSGNKYAFNRLTGLMEIIDSAQKGHGVLSNCQFNSVAEGKLASIKADLQDYAVSVIIAPYSLKIDTSLYLEEP